jgi:peptide/nickel transport system substrate-binding protein
VQRILDAETPVAWVYHSRGVQGVTSRLLGVRMDLRGEMPTVAQWRLSGATAIQ